MEMIRKLLLLSFIIIQTSCFKKSTNECLERIRLYEDVHFEIVVDTIIVDEAIVTIKGKYGRESSLDSFTDSLGVLKKSLSTILIGDTIIKYEDAFYFKVKGPKKLYLINIGCKEPALDSIQY